jgi:hypothetical protein
MKRRLLATLIASFCLAQPLCGQDPFAEATRRSPAVAAVLTLPRETPVEQLRAIFTLLDLGETDVAVELWKDFSKKKLNTETQAALVAKFGTARFLRLNQLDAEQFAGVREFVSASLKSSSERTRDPERLARLIRLLNDSSAETRRAARVDLAATSTAGASACLEALAQATEESVRANLMLALAEMRPEADPLLLAVLADGRGRVRRDVVELAGHAGLSRAIPWLAAFAAGGESDPTVVSAATGALTKLDLSIPSPAEARSVILSEIRRLEAGVPPKRQLLAEVATWWVFDTSSKKLVARELSYDARQLLSTARLSRLLMHLPDASEEDRQAALIHAYQAARELDQEPPAEVLEWVAGLRAAELNEALEQAIQKNSLAAARAFVDLLGRQADPAALRSQGGKSAPLTRALSHPDRRLRFAALRTVMQINPQKTFAGASAVPKAIWHFVTSSGTPEAVVAAPSTARAHEWASRLRGSAFAATPVVTGREAIRLALSSSRLQLILVDSDINRPPLREVVFQLRSQVLTGQTPLAVLCSKEGLNRAQQIAARDEQLIAVPRPHSAEAMQSIVERLSALSDPHSAELRLAQASQALTWLAELLEKDHPYDELLRDSHLLSETLYQPELTEATLRVLALVGTAKSQQLLVDLISTGAQPIGVRRQAADALAVSVERAGKLLTTQEIRRQYDRYNASETADAETQAVLSRVLDILEAK